MSNVSSVSRSQRQNVHFQYTNLVGFFAQDEASTDATKFDYVRVKTESQLSVQKADKRDVDHHQPWLVESFLSHRQRF